MEEQKMKAPSGGQKSHGFAIELVMFLKGKKFKGTKTLS